LLPFCSGDFVFCLSSERLKIKIQKTMILSVAVYGCGNWSLTLREENRYKESVNMVRKRIFGPKMEKMEGGWDGRGM